MSVKIMGLVWDLEIPPNEKLVLLAYADHADHAGFSIFPAVASIAKKTGYSERQVQRITRGLVNKGFLMSDGRGKKDTNKWRIPLYMGVIKPIDSRGVNMSPVTSETKGVTPVEKEGVTPMSPEPSVNHQLTIINNKDQVSSKARTPADAEFYSHFGNYYNQREQKRWIALIESVGFEQAQRIADWADKREIYMTNRTGLLDSMETAAKNWKSGSNKPRNQKDSNAEFFEKLNKLRTPEEVPSGKS